MRTSHSTHWLGISLFIVAAMAGCDQTAPNETSSSGDTQPGQATATAGAPLTTVNQYCPIMGGKVASDGGTAEWNGKLIGFCCPGCEPKWEKLAEDQKVLKLAEATRKSESETARADHDHS